MVCSKGKMHFMQRSTTEHVSALKPIRSAILRRWVPASGEPDAPEVIELYGENFDLRTGSRSNFAPGDANVLRALKARQQFCLFGGEFLV